MKKINKASFIHKKIIKIVYENLVKNEYLAYFSYHHFQRT